MANVVIQAGHVARKTGATGTSGEQVLNRSVCDLAAAKLRAYGHTTRVILADEVFTGQADVFIAHHADGSENATASGASVGYPDKNGGQLAHHFKVAYTARGWPYGFRADNYTPGLRGYYAYSRHDHIDRRMVVEAGFMTNPRYDRPWIDDHHGSIAQAVADAVNAVYGTPIVPQPIKPPAKPPDTPPPAPMGDVMQFAFYVSKAIGGDPLPPELRGWYLASTATLECTHFATEEMMNDHRARLYPHVVWSGQHPVWKTDGGEEFRRLDGDRAEDWLLAYPVKNSHSDAILARWGSRETKAALDAAFDAAEPPPTPPAPPSPPTR